MGGYISDTLYKRLTAPPVIGQEVVNDIIPLLPTVDISGKVDTTDGRLSNARTPVTHTHSYEPANTNIQTHVAFTAHAPAEAEVNVNADWNSSTGDSQIMNKPSIPAAQVQTDWNAGSGMGQLLNKPTISGSNTGDNSANTLYSGLAASKEDTGVAASAITTHAALKTGVHGMLANVIVFGQANPSAKTAAVTLTIAELLTGIVTGNPAAAAAYTLPTGTLCEGGLTIGVNEAFDWVLSNIATTATFIITLTAGTGHTIVGCTKVPSNSAATGGLWGTACAMFRTRKTATNTFVTYRIG